MSTYSNILDHPTRPVIIKRRRDPVIAQKGMCVACADDLSHGCLTVAKRNVLDAKLPYLIPVPLGASHIALHQECFRARNDLISRLRKGYDDMPGIVYGIQEVDVTPVQYQANGAKRQRIS